MHSNNVHASLTPSLVQTYLGGGSVYVPGLRGSADRIPASPNAADHEFDVALADGFAIGSPDIMNTTEYPVAPAHSEDRDRRVGPAWPGVDARRPRHLDPVHGHGEDQRHDGQRQLPRIRSGDRRGVAGQDHRPRDRVGGRIPGRRRTTSAVQLGQPDVPRVVVGRRRRRDLRRSTSAATLFAQSRPSARRQLAPCAEPRARRCRALFVAELEQEAGLPPGWLNVIVGPSSAIGDVLVEDERVKLITFTGSGAVGWGIQERARASGSSSSWATRRRRSSAPTPTAGAAAKLAANAFSFAGQSCISVQRIYVERAAYDEFVARFVAAVEALKVGDPADDATDVGPVIDEDARTRILAWIDEAKAAGATMLAGGEAGDLIVPTVLAGVPDRRRSAAEEVSGRW